MGLRLRIVAGPGMGSELALDDSEMTIGRAPENALVINDNNVSRVHAKVSMAGGRVTVADAGSRNGVYVNDRKVAEQPIGPGDRVVIGQTVMELVEDGPAARARPAAGAPAGRPGTGPSPRPQAGGNGRGGALAPAAQGRGMQQQRTGQMRANPAPKPGAKGSGGMPRVAAFVGVALVAAIFLGYAFLSGGPHPPAGNPDTTAKPAATLYLPPHVTQNTDADGALKINKRAQQWLDIGDSNRVSQNLPKARDAYLEARKADPSCDSCDVRLKAVLTEMVKKVSEYVRAGELEFDRGRYQAAIDRWQRALEYIGNPMDINDSELRNQLATQKRDLESSVAKAKLLLQQSTAVAP